MAAIEKRDSAPRRVTSGTKVSPRSAQISVRYDQKLEFILRHAARIFAEKSYHSTSMRDISRATGVSLAGLYHYCKSKEELLFLIQDNCFGRVLERLEERLTAETDPTARVRIFIDNHLRFFAANMAEMKVLSHEADSLRGDLQAHVFDKKQRYTRLARSLLANLQRERAADIQADLTIATYGLFGMMNWIYNWYDPQAKLKVAALVENIFQLFLYGFLGGSQATNRTFASNRTEESLSIWRQPLNDLKA